MIRRLAALGVLSVIAGLGVGVAAPAGASPTNTTFRTSRQALLRDAARLHPTTTDTPYGTCKLIAPATMRLTTEMLIPYLSLTGGCALHDGISAAWYAGGDNFLTSAYEVMFDHDGTGYGSDAVDFNGVGVMAWKGWFAFDDQGHTYVQNSPHTTVKVGSWAGLQTSRSGSKVTINTRAVRYATSLIKNIPWAGEPGVIQYRAKGGSTWTNLKNFTTNSAGATSFSYTSTATRDYRAIYTEQPYIWGATSPTSQR